MLQYQVSGQAPSGIFEQEEAKEEKQPEVKVERVPEKVKEELIAMHVSILEIEWEVTDKGLEELTSQIDNFSLHTVDKFETILVQGLKALCAYIREGKSAAHRDAFTILQSFYDSLELLVEDNNLDPEQRKQILIERVNSVNNLKDTLAVER